MTLILEEGDPVSRGNHSCDSDRWLADPLTATARRPIRPDEELTIDYALVTVDDQLSMPCRCRAVACRGVVRGSDWRLPELQGRYRGHFSSFIGTLIAGA